MPNDPESTDSLAAFTAAIKDELKSPGRATPSGVVSLGHVSSESPLGKLILAAMGGGEITSMPGGTAPDPISLPEIDPKLVSRWIRARLRSPDGVSHAAIPFMGHIADALEATPPIGNWLPVSVAMLVIIHAMGPDEMLCYDTFESRWVAGHADQINATLAEMRKIIEAAEHATATVSRPNWIGRAIRAILNRS